MLLSFLSFLVAASCCWAFSGVAEDVDPPLRAISESKLITPAEFTRKNVEGMFQGFLANHQPNYALVAYTIGSEKWELIRSTGQFMQSPTGIQNVRPFLPKSPIAQVIGFDGCAILRWRDQSGYFESVVRGSRDPTQFTVGGVQHKLLHFSLHRMRIKVPFADRDILTVFFQSMGPLTEANARQLVILMRKKTGVPAVRVVIRQDTWFLGDDFPEVYPFAEKIVVPSVVYFQESKTVSCSMTSRQPGPTCGATSRK